jgi:plasmid stability protein
LCCVYWQGVDSNLQVRYLRHMTSNEDKMREAFAAGERAYQYRVPRDRAVLGAWKNDPEYATTLRAQFLAGYDDAVARRVRY